MLKMTVIKYASRLETTNADKEIKKAIKMDSLKRLMTMSSRYLDWNTLKILLARIVQTTMVNDCFNEIILVIFNKNDTKIIKMAGMFV